MSSTGRLWLLHGWRVRDGGARSLGGLAGALEALGWEVVRRTYGYVLTPWETRFRSRKEAKILSTRVAQGDLVVGHSNGGRIALELTYYAPVDRVVLLNPALDSDWVPGRWTTRCLVVHNRHDAAGWWARLVPASPWGDMGRSGYRPAPGDDADPRMVNLRRGHGHSPYATDPDGWAETISRWAWAG